MWGATMMLVIDLPFPNLQAAVNGSTLTADQYDG